MSASEVLPTFHCNMKKDKMNTFSFFSFFSYFSVSTWSPEAIYSISINAGSLSWLQGSIILNCLLLVNASCPSALRHLFSSPSSPYPPAPEQSTNVVTDANSGVLSISRPINLSSLFFGYCAFIRFHRLKFICFLFVFPRSQMQKRINHNL